MSLTAQQASNAPARSSESLPSTNSVEFTKLTQSRLPYGEKITIRGTVGQLEERIADLKNWIEVQSVQVGYKSDGTQKEEISPVGKDQGWSVVVGPFPEGERVLLTISAKGPLKRERAEAFANEMAKYEGEIRDLLDQAYGRDSNSVRSLAENFAKLILQNLQKTLPDGFQLSSDIEGLSKQLATDTALINLVSRYRDTLNYLRNLGKEDLDYLRKLGLDLQIGDPSIQGVYNVLEKLREQCEQRSAPQEIRNVCADIKQQEGALPSFTRDYRSVFNSFRKIQLGSHTRVTASFPALASTKYLEKFAGFDLASIWVPRLDEMRAFAVAHVYWGPVELTPAPARSVSKGEWLRERLSLALGFSLKNISSSHPSKIRGNNVWVYGLGFRLNRYFRVTAGGAIYRGTAPDAGLRNDFFIGPSVDLTAIEYFRQIFAKVKSAQ